MIHVWLELHSCESRLNLRGSSYIHGIQISDAQGSSGCIYRIKPRTILWGSGFIYSLLSWYTCIEHNELWHYSPAGVEQVPHALSAIVSPYIWATTFPLWRPLNYWVHFKDNCTLSAAALGLCLSRLGYV